MNLMEQFERNISYRASLGGEGLILSATLQDVFHDICLEVTVDIESMAIVAAKADFRKAPTGYCSGVAHCMEKLTGLVIGKGMNRRLLEIFGGSDGCGNLRTMLAGLLPLALNIKAARGISDENEMFESISKKLVGTCAGYPAND
jgi:hypothetical protein